MPAKLAEIASALVLTPVPFVTIATEFALMPAMQLDIATALVETAAVNLMPQALSAGSAFEPEPECICVDIAVACAVKLIMLAAIPLAF